MDEPTNAFEALRDAPKRAADPRDELHGGDINVYVAQKRRKLVEQWQEPTTADYFAGCVVYLNPGLVDPQRLRSLVAGGGGRWFPVRFD